jgi:predicted Ser/Thr protein kinase
VCRLKGVHTAPPTLRVASVFIILTRLEPAKKAGLSLMKKLKLYDGDTVEGFTSKHVKEIQDEAHRQGMMGISPRIALVRRHAAQPLTNRFAPEPALARKSGFCASSTLLFAAAKIWSSKPAIPKKGFEGG